QHLPSATRSSSVLGGTRAFQSSSCSREGTRPTCVTPSTFTSARYARSSTRATRTRYPEPASLVSAAPDTDRHIARAALLVSLAGAWLNLLLTTRWSSIAGSVNGPKRPYFVAALIAATALPLTFRGDTT